jgi:nucleoside-diphosphate-sugar epimerase
MRTLVTGATGFIGRHLAERLVREGQEVVAFTRPGSDTRFLAALGVHVVSGDLCDAAGVARAAQACDWVFHLAGARPANRPDSSSYRRVNVEGTLNVARAALDVGAPHLVFASTVGVFGFTRSGVVDETTPAHPDTRYRASKLEAERALLDLHHRRGLAVTIARLSSVIGPGSKSWLAFCRALDRDDVRLIGSGANCLQISDVSDAVEGLMCCAKGPDVSGEMFILAGAPISLREYVGAVRRAIHRSERIGWLPAAPYLAFARFASYAYRAIGLEVPQGRRYEAFLEDKILDTSKARRVLNYAPRVTPHDAVARMVRWYKDQGWLGQIGS